MPDRGDWRARLERFSPYLRSLLERAVERARRLHADHVALEHLIGAAVEDEESAAYQATEHAFADPELVARELLALSPGVMVVGSEAALPFSPAAVEALWAARDAAAAAGSSEVSAAVVLAHALAALPEDLRGALARAGYRAPAPAPGPASGSERGAGERTAAVDREAPLFRHFSSAAKQALSRANKAASRGGEESIGPARILLACLEIEPPLAARVGLGGSAARAALAGRTADPTRPPQRALDPDRELLDFLERLPDRSGSLELFLECLRGEHPELRELLGRHKLSTAMLERAAEAFSDPEP